MRRPLRMFFSFDARLHEELRLIARQQQSARTHQRGALLWGALTVYFLLLLGMRFAFEGVASWLVPLLLVGFLVASVVFIVQVLRDRIDLIRTAREIEKEHPELGEALRTAAEQNPGHGGRLTFLQRRLLRDVLDRAGSALWHQPPRTKSRQYGSLHALLAITALITAGVAVRYASPFYLSWPDWRMTPGVERITELEITPGNQEVEKGSTVVVAARFPGRLPESAWLEWQDTDGKRGREAMARSLSDPVYAFTLQRIEADTVYSVSYDNNESDDFALTIYELPELVRADADLDYPDYTGREDRTITDTRRISAVEGTRLDYRFLLNRPVETAVLRDESGEELTLSPDPEDPRRWNASFALAESARYQLHLTDATGRVDPTPADIRIEVTPNQLPELKFDFPRGDQRVSALQEIHLTATAADDFGLLDFGIATAIGSADPEFVSYATDSANPLEAQLQHLIDLESAGVEVDELITWFLWADDYAPDGSVRRSTGDLYFAEVRPFDEVFREEEGGGQGAGGSPNGGPAGDLLETQRQISIAIWKQLQSGEVGDSFGEDVTTLRDAQLQAQAQLSQMRTQLSQPRQQGAAERADRSMKVAADALDDAAEDVSADPLETAWKGAQSAYRALLPLQPRETSIVQSQNGQGGSGRNRSQIDQLRLRREANRYANQNQPEAEVAEEEREQLNLLSRLRDLARRQADLNERLQELQTALAAAEDEAERERIRRELKRLEEEQRRMLADLDEANQRLDRLDAGEQREQARQQLEQSREDMQEASERLAEGEVSSALASGTRAQESLAETSDELREESSSVFKEQLQKLRDQARDLAAEQDALEQQWQEAGDGPRSLDDGPQRDGLAEALEEQRDRHAQLLEDLRQVTEDSEGTEPTLHRQLYDLLRRQGSDGPGRDLETSAELLRRGFFDDARRQQAGVGENIDRLREGIEQAADSVLGNAESELRFATSELSDLVDQLRDERPEQTQAQPGSGTTPMPGEENGADRETETGPGLGPDESGDQLAQVPGAGENPGEMPSPGDAPGDEAPGQTPGGTEPNRMAGGPAPEGTESNQPGGNQPGDQEPGSSSGEGREGEPRMAGAGTTPSGQPGDAPTTEALQDALSQLMGGGENQSNQPRPGGGPLTGADFAEWNERLRTVESLLEDDELRQRLGEARSQAEEERSRWQREGSAPRWDIVETAVINPLVEVQEWLRQELARREDPTTLQPIDRDPVPDRFAEIVRRYYESLGSPLPDGGTNNDTNPTP